MNNWPPINTAPKDGTEILLWTHAGIIQASWDWHDWGYFPVYPTYDGIGGVALSSKPTHWQPLPEPPEGFWND